MIQVDGLTKYYGAHAAIRELSFHIDKGEVIGFLGLNGAGKSTTLRILGCVLLPTSGKVTIDGFDVVADPHEIRKRIGFLPDTPPLYDEMTVAEYLRFVAGLRGVSPGDLEGRVRKVEEQTSLASVHDEIVGSLSHGFRQRLGIAQALVHNPALLILDEPTSGLDPVQIVEMRELIRKLKGSHTILLSSHILSEIHQTCDRLLVIQEGEIVAQGTEEEIGARTTSSSGLEVEIGGPDGPPPIEPALAAIRAVSGVAGAQLGRDGQHSAVLRVDAPGALAPEVVRALVAAKVDVLGVSRTASQLESIFLRLTQGKGQPS